MDESWGNILYLIAMALFVIFGALRKKKPPEVIAPPDEEELFQQSTLKPSAEVESIFESLLGKQIPEPYVKSTKESELKEDVVQMEEPIQRKFEPEHTDESKLSALKWQYGEEIDDEEVVTDEIDWRNAIIYKEILERKYN